MHKAKKKPKTRKLICLIFSSLIILTLTFLIYLGLWGELNKLTKEVQIVTISSEGPAAEMYPDSMGQYNILKEVYRYDRAVYKHVDREDRFIICAGKISLSRIIDNRQKRVGISNTCPAHRMVHMMYWYLLFVLRWDLVHHTRYLCWGGKDKKFTGFRGFSSRAPLGILWSKFFW